LQGKADRCQGSEKGQVLCQLEALVQRLDTVDARLENIEGAVTVEEDAVAWGDRLQSDGVDKIEKQAASDSKQVRHVQSCFHLAALGASV
jgi:hypothetical protein